MSHQRQQKMTVRCAVSGTEIPINEAVPVDLVRESLLKILKESQPNLDTNGYISMAKLDEARFKYAENLAASELGELAELKRQVAESLERQEVLTRNVDAMFEQKATMGEKIADKVAAFGGSWTFIIIFGVILFTWMGINSVALLGKPFDPFPFIFLNLILSCLAAIQAPVIMMSQNRQETKDRLRGENDYKVNLKAELEIQHINEKIDKLINDQWKHLLEIQQMQMEMIQEYRGAQKGGNS
ncbi:MAG: DUF1003 domain-containing protein [Armatimonadetes bacterium]|nr:DUF1003 domain-containing protein [Armatimonadota bacterium]